MRGILTVTSLIYAMNKCVQPNHIPVLIELIESTKDDSYVALLDGLRLCSNRAWMQNDESSAKRVAVYLSNLATNGSHSFCHSARRTLLNMALGMELEILHCTWLMEEEIQHHFFDQIIFGYDRPNLPKDFLMLTRIFRHNFSNHDTL